MIRFVCWSCGKALKAQPAHAGLKCNCNGCGESNTIPSHGVTITPPADDTVIPNESDVASATEAAVSQPVARQASHGKMFCYKCGVSIFEEAELCPHCGVRQRRAGIAQGNPKGFDGNNRVVAALLAFFLGILGAHKFYLGQPIQGVAYLIAGLGGFFMASILWWAIVFPFAFPLFFLPNFILTVLCIIDGVSYLAMTDEKFNATYNQ